MSCVWSKSTLVPVLRLLQIQISYLRAISVTCTVCININAWVSNLFDVPFKSFIFNKYNLVRNKGSFLDLENKNILLNAQFCLQLSLPQKKINWACNYFIYCWNGKMCNTFLCGCDLDLDWWEYGRVCFIIYTLIKKELSHLYYVCKNPHLEKPR